MPLSPREQSELVQIASGIGQAAVSASVAPALGASSLVGLSAAGVSLSPGAAGVIGPALGSLGGALFAAGAFVPPVLGLLATINDPSFPKLEVGRGGIGQVVTEAAALRSRGLTPVISTDPFTGNVALSTVDQSSLLPQLLFEAAFRDEFSATETDIDAIRSARDQLIDQLAATARTTLPDLLFPIGFSRETPTGPLIAQPVGGVIPS